MPSPYRQVLIGRFIQGLTPRAIATGTGETANTISVRIFRGLKHLRFLLEQPPADTREHLLLPFYDR